MDKIKELEIKHPTKDFNITVGKNYRVEMEVYSPHRWKEYETVTALVYQIGHHRIDRKPLVYIEYNYKGQQVKELRYAEAIVKPA